MLDCMLLSFWLEETANCSYLKELKKNCRRKRQNKYRIRRSNNPTNTVGRSAKEFPSDSADLGSLGTSGQSKGSKLQSLWNGAKNLTIETGSGCSQWCWWISAMMQLTVKPEVKGLWDWDQTGWRHSSRGGASSVSLWSVELGLESPCLSFPSLSLVFLFVYLPCVAHGLGLSVCTSECLLDHFLVPVKAYQNLVEFQPVSPSQRDTRAIRFTYESLLISEHFDKTQCLTFWLTEPARDR